jgi:hypothetical protein
LGDLMRLDLALIAQLRLCLVDQSTRLRGDLVLHLAGLVPGRILDLRRFRLRRLRHLSALLTGRVSHLACITAITITHDVLPSKPSPVIAAPPKYQTRFATNHPFG